MEIIEIVKIVVPSLVALIVPFVTYRWLTRRMADYQTILSKEIEDYKKNISRELYQFQTKFSLYHQKKAEAIAEIYGLLAELDYVLSQVTHWFQRSPTDEELKRQLDEKKIKEVSKCLEDFYVSFIKNRIFLDEDTCKILDEIARKVRAGSNFYIESVQSQYSKMNMFSRKYFEESKEHLKLVPEIKKILETQLRKILSAENPNNQLEKKQ